MKGNTVLLISIFILLCCSLYVSYTNYQQIQLLRQEFNGGRVSCDTLVVMKEDGAKEAVKENAKKTVKRNTKQVVKENVKKTIVVSTKYRIEDRYVVDKVQKPELIGDQTGEVVLSISVNFWGDVRSAKIQSVTGITNEDVIEACKKAALKTRFNLNNDMSSEARQSGTITYTFSAE